MRRKSIGCSVYPIAIFLVWLFVPPAFAGQWVNPKDAIGDPNIARLRPGERELTERGKEDIKRYGYTGLELMVYLDDNKDAGEDNRYQFRRYQINRRGIITTTFEGGHVREYYYKDHRALITFDGINPGDVQIKFRGFGLYPPEIKGGGGLFYTFLREKIEDEIETGWRYDINLRRVTRRLNADRSDTLSGSQITWDDWRWREPWEENHRILGEDSIDGLECFVVESVNLDPNYYLSKRVTWIEKQNFLDPHEEQFDKKGRLYKVINRKWKQIEPWNYWVEKERDYYNVVTHGRAIQRTFHWLFDQDPKESLFEPQIMETYNTFPGGIKPLPPRAKNSANFPPKPTVRDSFWQKGNFKAKPE